MGWRGTLRSIAAAQRRIEREEQRRQREAEKNYRFQLKLHEAERAAMEVDRFQDRIQQLISIHREVGDEVDWFQVRDTPMPSQPVRSSIRENNAVAKLNAYKPSFFEKLLGNDKKAIALLAAALVDAKAGEERDFSDAWKFYTDKVESVGRSRALANAILGGEIQAYYDAIYDLAPLAEMQEMGCGIQIGFIDSQRGEVTLEVESTSVIPKELLSLTKSGKVSAKPMPEKQFHELYQDYVCGCALRAARELFSFLPLKLVVVNVQTSLLDTATGHMTLQTVLSVAIVRATLEKMNFHSVDASDSMKLFVHKMGFKRSEGFHPIQALRRSDYPTG